MSTTTNNNTNSKEEITEKVMEGTERMSLNEEPFKTVSSINEKLMTKRLMDRIREDFGTDPVVFLKHLTENDSYIVGQYILETVHNERYIGNSITMYIIRYFDIEKNNGDYDPLSRYLLSISPCRSIENKNNNSIVHDFPSKGEKKIRMILRKRETNSPRIPVFDNNFVSIFNCSFGGQNYEFDSGRSVLFPINDLSFKLDDWTDIKNKVSTFSIPPNFDLKNKMNLKEMLEQYDNFFSHMTNLNWPNYRFKISSETSKKIVDSFSDVIDTCGLYARKDYEGILKLFKYYHTSNSEQIITYNPTKIGEKKYSFKSGTNNLLWGEHETLDGLFGLIFDNCKKQMLINQHNIYSITLFLVKDWYEL